MTTLIREAIQRRRVGRPARRGRLPAAAAAASVRGRLMGITTLAISPVVLFASAIALQHAYGAVGFAHVAAWVAAATIPLLAGAGAVLVVSLAAEALILRWLVYLERLSRAYSRGKYSLRPQRLADAPSEFRSLGVAVADMAAAVEDRDHALRAAIDEQAVLLREVHHRVKNNLQIVGSLLSLQASKARDPGVKRGLVEALVRIDAMGLSQRFMQPTEAEDRVSARELFTAFAAQTRARLGRARDLVLQLDVEDVMLDLDTGSRLVLVAAEAVLQICGRSAEPPPTCRIALWTAGEDVILTVSALDAPDAFAPIEDAIFGSLIDGYVRQLRGVTDKPSGDDGVLRVRAPLRQTA